MFSVISVYFNIRNTLPKSGTFLLGHPVYIYIYMCVYGIVFRYTHTHTHTHIYIVYRNAMQPPEQNTVETRMVNFLKWHRLYWLAVPVYLLISPRNGVLTLIIVAFRPWAEAVINNICLLFSYSYCQHNLEASVPLPLHGITSDLGALRLVSW